MALLGGCGTCQQYQYTNAPVLRQSADSANRYSQSLIDNRNDIFINQPIINTRDHFVNNIHSQLIRDNNHYHYHTQNLFRDNVHHRYYQQVFRQQNNFYSSSSSCGVLPGCVTHSFAGTSFAHLGCNHFASCCF